MHHFAFSIQRRRGWIFLLSLPLCLLCLAPARPAGAKPDPNQPPPGATPKETEIGDKAAAEFEKSPKIKLMDAAKSPKQKELLDKLNKMAMELGQASARPGIKYTVKVVMDDDMNAFTLPNGHIYVYWGLVQYVGSDDELASVLAHEIGHNARMHALRAEAKAKTPSLVGMGAMLAALLSGSRSGLDVAQFTQYLLIGVMNGYGVEFEKEADQAAITEMVKTAYNPSALVTFMQRLEQYEKQRPDIGELGIFRTHPPTEERVNAALAGLAAAGLKFTPREVSGGKQAVAVEAKDRVAVKFGDLTLAEFALQPNQTPTALDRAQAMATQLNQLLRADLKMYEVNVSGDASGAQLLARGIELARITPADAKLADATPLVCAQKWRDTLRRIFWHETISGKL